MEEQNLDNNHSEQLTKKERRELKRQERQEEKGQRAKSKTMKRIISWLVVVLVIGGGIFALVKFSGSAPTQQDGGNILSEQLNSSDHIYGNPEAKVVLLEYLDFQCPACAAYDPLVQELKKEYSDRVAFVVRHFPLRSIHANAQISSQAAEAAGLQGKFWEMHDMIFENQAVWSNGRGAKSIFLGYAESLGLDKDKFEDDLDSSQVKDKIEADLKSGNNSGVNGTPSFFLNGKKIVNPQSLDAFKKLLDSALSDAGVETAVPSESVTPQ
ncbi:MAG: thioredoxin domain-containing protein [bacterium]|nr:thioredoxin domain-containing protein [bacterium]